MTPQKKESALGRGLDALIKPDIGDKTNKKNKEKSNKRSVTVRSSDNKERQTNTNKKFKSSETIKYKSIDNKTSDEGSKDLNTSVIDGDLIDNVISEVHKNPRISLWSAKSAAVLRLLKKTKPEFSISKEASALIEEAVKSKYPDLWDVFEEKDI